MTRTRDPDAKKQLLLEAGLGEFAEHGISGARIDRLAKRAGVSAGLVYTYFDNKEGLFEAVYDTIVEQVTEAAPITPDDLADYAGRLFDAAGQHPEVMRFVAWYALERGDDAATPAAVTQSMSEKTTAIAAAQQRGAVTDRWSPGQLLALVLTLANMWDRHGDGVRGLVPEHEHRATIVQAVRALTTP
ncbi:MAG: TetR family transcriptional regulator [Actinomycetota bacterium]|nr:TetR family transcriptional regulator [Actinomycetota bacterium]